jgi:hypothetical protein
MNRQNGRKYCGMRVKIQVFQTIRVRFGYLLLKRDNKEAIEAYFYSKLSLALSIKAGIGVRIRNAYIKEDSIYFIDKSEEQFRFIVFNQYTRITSQNVIHWQYETKLY